MGDARVTIRTALSDTLAIKLASLAIHAEEAASPTGSPFDADAIRGLIADAEVGAWLDTFDPVLLPVKRQPSRGCT